MIIERLDEDQAFIKFNGQTFSLPRVLLPRAAREGDALKIAIALLPPHHFPKGRKGSPHS